MTILVDHWGNSTLCRNSPKRCLDWPLWSKKLRFSTAAMTHQSCTWMQRLHDNKTKQPILTVGYFSSCKTFDCDPGGSFTTPNLFSYCLVGVSQLSWGSNPHNPPDKLALATADRVQGLITTTSLGDPPTVVNSEIVQWLKQTQNWKLSNRAWETLTGWSQNLLG